MRGPVLGPLGSQQPQVLGWAWDGPQRELGSWELAEVGSWENLKDPQKGPAGANLCVGPRGERGKALLLTCYVKKQVPGLSAPQPGRLPGGWDRELFLRDKEAGHE